MIPAFLRILAAIAIGYAVMTGGAMAQARTEVPIRAQTLSNGFMVFSIPVRVGKTAIEAGLDTGSTGLRILPGVLAPGDAQDSSQPTTGAYGSGTQISGVVASGQVAIGGAAGPARFENIHTVGCTAGQPKCPASKIPLAQFGMMGFGLPGAGFRAIIGISMANAPVPNPLLELGARSWIVELPRPGGGEAGTLILNPSDTEVNSFTLLPLVKGTFHDGVEGCLINQNTNGSACGPTLMDSGTPSISVSHSDLRAAAWGQGTPAAFSFSSDSGVTATESFSVGKTGVPSRVSIGAGGAAPAAINGGQMPYFGFDVLYLPSRNLIGVRPRSPLPGTIQATLTTGD